VDLAKPAGEWGVEGAFRLGAFDLTDLLPFGQNRPLVHVPIEKVHVLQQPHGVGRKANAETRPVPLGPHVVPRVLAIGGEPRGELAHHEGQLVSHRGSYWWGGGGSGSRATTDLVASTCSQQPAPTSRIAVPPAKTGTQA